MAIEASPARRVLGVIALGPRPEDAVRAFAASATSAERARLRAEIDTLLAAPVDDAGLARRLDAMRLAVDIQRFGFESTAAFLRCVREIVDG